MYGTDSDIWRTAVIAVETSVGRRFRGVCYVARGRSWAPRRYVNSVGDTLPPKADVAFVTPLMVHLGDAHEAARSRTIHHNLYHLVEEDNTPVSHVGMECPEYEAVAA